MAIWLFAEKNISPNFAEIRARNLVSRFSQTLSMLMLPRGGVYSRPDDEIEKVALQSNPLGTTVDNKQILMIDYKENTVMDEIGRLREMTFRFLIFMIIMPGVG